MMLAVRKGRCKGCGHIFQGAGYHKHSVPNNEGYCGWCCAEGTDSDEALAALDAASTYAVYSHSDDADNDD